MASVTVSCDFQTFWLFLLSLGIILDFTREAAAVHAMRISASPIGALLAQFRGIFSFQDTHLADQQCGSTLGNRHFAINHVSKGPTCEIDT